MAHSVVSWFGGKNKMAKQIVGLMPKHETFVDVFGGGANLIINKKRAKFEVYNDVNAGLVSLFRTLRSKEDTQRLIEALSLTLYSREEFDQALRGWEHGLVDNSKQICRLNELKEEGKVTEEQYDKLIEKLNMERFQKLHYKIKEEFDIISKKLKKDEITQEEYNTEWEKIEERRKEDQIERARMFYLLCQQSFSAGLKSWKCDKSNKVAGLPPTIKRWLNGIDENLPWAVERFRTISVENMSYEYILERYDSPDTLFYLDPPYIHSTRGKDEEVKETLEEKKETETQEEFDERVKNQRKKSDYHHELTDDMHVDLVNRLLKLKGKFVMSGYDHPIYDKLNDGEKFFKVKLDDFAKACQKSEVGQKKDVGEEFLWINFKPGTL